jgi:two-component system, sensor histidine kinase
VTRETAQILVVDDNDPGRFVKSQILRRAGFAVHEAATGMAALELCRQMPFDLVVLDVNLPDINGLDVGRQLRAEQPGPPALQILHVSGTAISDGDRARGLNAGADAYLAEPVNPTVLLATADALLRVRHAEESLAAALAREQRARSEAEQANRLKDEFIATLSHELRTPLNALMGWIWQLRQTTMSEAAKAKALDSLERNTRIQAQLINDLLDVSRITKGKLQLQIRPIDLARTMDAARESIGPAAATKGVDVEIRAEQVWAAGDEGRLQQIVDNLLNNAVQFTPPGGRVHAHVARASGEAVITVADTGAGIEPALLPYVFEPFRQGKDGLSRVHGGLGLGLAVVHQLVDLHDGSVSVESDGVNRGATFIVRLPEYTPKEIPADGEPTPLLLEGLRTLVIAEPGELRETLAAILNSSGAKVEQLAGAPTDTSQREGFDVIVWDMESGVGIAAGDHSGGWRRPPQAIVPTPVRPAALVRAAADVSKRQRSERPSGN